ncbi:MAG: GNAT family N-acetyltransferase [Planctomycetales bacterium]|nr:GNAT family N-acetyltransferase [Planctomycetales bacterium]
MTESTQTSDEPLKQQMTGRDDSPSIEHLTLREWQAFVASHPRSTVFHHHRWLELLSAQYAMKLKLVALRREGEILAAIPFLECRSFLGSRKLISLPFSDVQPFLQQSPKDGEQLLSALDAHLPQNYRSIVIRCDEPLPTPYSTSHFVRHEINLDRPFAEIEKTFDSNIRRNLRRAQEGGLRFDSGVNRSLMEDFYRLHLATRKKHGVPIQPKSYFLRLQKEILEPGLGIVGRVSHNDRAVAAAVFLTYNQTFLYKYGASDINALALRPNDLLLYHGLRVGCERGYRQFDFGVSDRAQDGLRRFKTKWGAVESDAFHCYVRGEPEEARTNSLALRTLSPALRVAPAWCCRALGELFYRYSP